MSFRVDRESRTLSLQMGLWQGKQVEPILVRADHLPAEGEILIIELLYDRGLMLGITYDDGVEQPSACNGENVAAIDLGENHGISAVATSGQSIIITSRLERSIKRLRNKKQAELRRKMSKCTKHSRQWRKYNQALQYVLSKSDAQLADILHKSSAEFVKWAVKNGVNEVVVGDLDGVQRNRSARKKHNKQKRRRTSNQKLNQWSFGKLSDYLKYKLAAKGVSLIKADESYTTQTCPVCGRRRKPIGRVYTCSCGYKQHRDVHGALNFLAKHLHGEIRDMGLAIRTKYLQPVHVGRHAVDAWNRATTPIPVLRCLPNRPAEARTHRV